MQTELDLLASTDRPEPIWIGRQAVVLPGFALAHIDDVLAPLARIVRTAPWRNMLTPGGQTIAVRVTNCGSLGWISDRRGYRYSPTDPLNDHPWPALPDIFLDLAAQAAAAAGFPGFVPDACLINCYLPGNRLTLHQDRNEQDFNQPIVSLSLGLPATFQFGGHERSDHCQKVSLNHGDMMAWGGEDRLRYHGVMTLKPGEHPRLGARRISLTFRKAGP